MQLSHFEALQKAWSNCQAHALPLASESLKAKILASTDHLLRLMVTELGRPMSDKDDAEMLARVPQITSELCSQALAMLKEQHLIHHRAGACSPIFSASQVPHS